MTTIMSEKRATAPTRWTVDHDETSVDFAVKTFWGLSTVRGRFDHFRGSYEVGPDGMKIELTIDADSLDNDGNNIVDDAPEAAPGAMRIKLAVQQNVAGDAAGAGANSVYAALIGSKGYLMGIFDSKPDTTGATKNDWTQHAWQLSGTANAVEIGRASCRERV